MTGPEDWYLSAESRWKHLPAGSDRDRRVQQTFLEIREESEAVAVKLPELDDAELQALLEEAVLDSISRRGLPLTDADEAVCEHHIDLLFFRLCLRAREAKAEPRVRSLLLERRLFRMPGIRSYLRLATE